MLYTADSAHAFPCSELYEPGSFFEIDHEKLPPKSPIQLKSIRVVMVSETTLLGVTVNFPSTLSLRSYFMATKTGICFPELDERFVMSSNQAGRILRRRVSLAQLEVGKCLKSFWLLAPVIEPKKEPEVTKRISSMGSCHLALKLPGQVGWGLRRKIKYIGRHCNQPSEIEEQQSGNGRKKTKRKRKEFGAREIKRSKQGRFPCGTKERWSAERYELAEKRLLEIMRSKKAELGRPILRQALREEARKHIGDTGLLDHLLKHMAGKIVSDGVERFRRRHNSEGAMEYWLEPADLVEVRRKAGVTDPFWVPPPGWKVGDSFFPNSCGHDCRVAIADCKQQLAAQCKRYDEQQISLKKLEKHTQNIKAEWEKAIGAWQEKYHILLEWKRKQEEDLAALLDCMQELKDDVQLLRQHDIKETEQSEGAEQLNKIPSDANIENEVSNGRSAANKKQKKSSVFKICKPQGTFLWPIMAGSSNASADEKQQQQQQHMMMFPGGGPPSASSSTASTPKLSLLPAPSPLPSDPSSELLAVPRERCADICTMNTIVPRCEVGSGDNDALAAAGSPWKKDEFGWNAITTDLVLTTPSPYR